MVQVKLGSIDNIGLDSIKKTELYSYILTCVPTEDMILTFKMFDGYPVRINPQYMSVLGTMCDYGARSHSCNRCYGYVEIGIACGYISTSLSQLLYEDFLSAEEAYWLATLTKPKNLGDDFIGDYAILTERAVSMYRALNLSNPLYGAYYNAPAPINSIECDCASDDSIVDIKVSRTCEHNKDYWAQVLLYSFLSKVRDGKSRKRICLIYPVQGVIKLYEYGDQAYSALYKIFEREGLNVWIQSMTRRT